MSGTSNNRGVTCSTQVHSACYGPYDGKYFMVEYYQCSDPPANAHNYFSICVSMLHLHGKYKSLHPPQLKVYCQCGIDEAI